MARAPKAKTEEIVEDIVEDDTMDKVSESTPDASAEMIKMLQKQLAEMQKQLNEKLSEPAAQPQVVIQQDRGFSSKKIKCINLMHNRLNVSTEPDGAGRPYWFDSYGDVRLIKYDDLAEIVTSYPYTVENGLMYIADKKVVEELGLSEVYEKLYTKEMIDEIKYLRKDSDIEMLLGMEKNLRDSTLDEVARLINYGEDIDFNYIRRIKQETGIDLEEVADQIKLSSKEVSTEEKEKIIG